MRTGRNSDVMSLMRKREKEDEAKRRPFGPRRRSWQRRLVEMIEFFPISET